VKSLFKLALLLGGLAVLGLIAMVGFVWLSEKRSSLPTVGDNRDEVLRLLVRRESRGLIVTNNTDSAWDYCTATMTGDYTLTVSVLKRRETVNFPHAKFAAGSTQLDEDQGYARAIRGLDIVCEGRDNRRHHARIE
jgi:hypothetical protein